MTIGHGSRSRYNSHDTVLDHRFLFLPAGALALASILIACGDGTQVDTTPTVEVAGAPRSFAMGLSSLPPELTEESYASAFERASTAGEVILIQRIPPWDDLLGGDLFPSDSVAQETQRETALAEEYELELFVAIDPTDEAGDGGQLAGLPEELRGADFADEAVREAFIRYAQYVALNYQPRYLALGVEVNTLEEQNPDDFGPFVSLYAEAYDAVKELSPDTLVFPTFQLEALQGLLSGEVSGKAQWYLLGRFEPRMDLLAVSSYPSLVFSDPAEIPDDYYSQIRTHTSLPVAFVEIGYSSGEDGNGQEDAAEGGQATFLELVLEDAGDLDAPLLIWFLGQDPSFTGDPPLDMLGRIGLLRADGTEKEAWSVWLTASRRPLVGDAATEASGR